MTDTPTPVSAEAPAPDLVERLRATTDGATVNPDGLEAADEIDRLKAELHIATEWSARVHAAQQDDADTITALRAENERLSGLNAQYLASLEEAAQFVQDECHDYDDAHRIAAAIRAMIKETSDD
jgi:hypothetical protein